MPALAPQSLAALLDAGAVRVGLDAPDKEALLEALVGLVADTPAVTDAKQLLADVNEREALMSTGVGQGLALPHARTSAVRSTVAAFAVLAAPLEYEALDGEPVQLALLLAGPEEERGNHVRLLSRVSRLLSRDDLRTTLLEAGSAEAALNLIRDGEAVLT